MYGRLNRAICRASGSFACPSAQLVKQMITGKLSPRMAETVTGHIRWMTVSSAASSAALLR